MGTKTVTTEFARLNLRNILDDALIGEQTIIERYGKPVAAVINPTQLRNMTAELAHLRRIVKSDAILARTKEADWIDLDNLDKALAALDARSINP
jgi:hypothetical protein